MRWPWSCAPVWRVAPAELRHAEAIAAIHAGSFARGWSGGEIEAMLIDRSIVADVASDAPGADRIQGFVLSRLAGEADILSIAVAPNRRGKGAAAALLAHHLGRLEALATRRVVLEVDEANTAARRLYERFGFAVVGARPSYYARPDGTRGAALLLARTLG